MKRVEGYILATAFLCVLAAAIAYVAAFGRGELGGVEEWAQFGDYFGGLVNPAVGLVTVVLVVITLRVTREEAASTRREMALQLSHLSTQAVLGDMHKRLEGLMAEWERRVTEVAASALQGTTIENGAVNWTTLTVREALENAAYKARLEDRRAKHQGDVPFCESTLKSLQPVLPPLLQELGQYCQEYDALSENGHLTMFYKRRVRSIAEVLDLGGLLSEDVRSSVLT